MASTSSASSAVCGNGVREAGEQCDDGNANGLDACSATCQFEQAHRINSLKLEYAPTTFCPANVIGKAIGSTAQGDMQSALDGTIRDGSISVLLQFRGSNDALQIGSMLGAPAAGQGYDGTQGLDWWYKPDRSSLDANQNPTRVMYGSIVNGLLSAQGAMTFTLAFGAGDDVAMSSARLQAKVGDSSAPTTSMSGPVGHLPNEHLDPALQTTASLGDGELCGNLSAASLAAMKVPAELTEHCGDYTTSNSILDFYVGGCKVFFFTVVAKTQPDQADPKAPVAGAGAPYTFKAGADKKVNACVDKTGAPVNLDACLKAAAFSSAFKLTTNRVVVRD